MSAWRSAFVSSRECLLLFRFAYSHSCAYRLFSFYHFLYCPELSTIHQFLPYPLVTFSLCSGALPIRAWSTYISIYISQVQLWKLSIIDSGVRVEHETLYAWALTRWWKGGAMTIVKREEHQGLRTTCIQATDSEPVSEHRVESCSTSQLSCEERETAKGGKQRRAKPVATSLTVHARATRERKRKRERNPEKQ